MSRIDKALQRASPSPAHREGALDPHALDEYPREGRTAVPDAEAIVALPRRPAPLVQPSIARGSVALDPLTESSHCARLAALLQDSRASRRLKAIAITCTDEAEGKAFVTLSLAASLGQVSGGRVLLVDSDPQPPFVHDVLRVANAGGWSDLLEDATSQVGVVPATPLLHVMTIGQRPQAIAGHLASPDTRPVLDACGAAYEWVLLNAPPLSFFREPRLLARHADGVVFVAGRSTPFPLVERSLSALGREHVVGTVMIGLDDRRTS